MKIKLKTGRVIQVEAFNMSKTYGGLLVGEPDETMNDRIIDLISYSKEWGNHKTLLNTKNMYVSKDVLKSVIYSAWLDSEPINDLENYYDGSEIVVSWFGEEQIKKSIKEIIEAGLSDFDYEKHAVNYQI